MNWEQRCYIVIADSVSGMPPLLHGVRWTQWEAFRALEQIHSALPAKLTQNLRVVPAHLVFNDAAGEDEDSAKEIDT